jgi:hypothetical protein
VSKLEQAKSVLMEDKDAAAAEHTATIARINTHTSKIFAVFKRDLYLTIGARMCTCCLVVCLGECELRRARVQARLGCVRVTTCVFLCVPA